MIAAVVIAFNPKKPEISSLVNSLASQVAFVIVVDNSEVLAEESIIDGIDDSKITWVSLGKNRGIAHAQNLGVNKAKQLGAEFVCFFDQDSEVSDG